MEVATLIVSAFRLASSRQPRLHQIWIGISFRIGSLLPNSSLLFSIQRVGELDLVLRCMEDDFRIPVDESQPETFHGHYQIMLSEAWIGSIYEIIRLLIERKLLTMSDELQSIAHELRLLRIPLEKHEIAIDRKLTEPLRLSRMPVKNDTSDEYTYSKDDPTRAHIMPLGISERGSAMWQVIDISSGSEYWIERRKLSERIVALWDSNSSEPNKLS